MIWRIQLVIGKLVSDEAGQVSTVDVAVIQKIFSSHLCFLNDLVYEALSSWKTIVGTSARADYEDGWLAKHLLPRSNAVRPNYCFGCGLPVAVADLIFIAPNAVLQLGY